MTAIADHRASGLRCGLRSARRFALLALLVSLAGGCERAIFGLVNRGVAPPAASVVYDPEHGLSLDLYRPAATAEPAPVLVFFYGGAWQRGSRAQYAFVGERLAAHGVLTIVADYRTWPAAGFPAFVHDAARASAWAHQHAGEHGGDPDRLFLAGHSAGAQIAALLGTDPRYLRAHGIAPTQLAGVIGLAGPYDFEITGRFRAVFGAPTQWPDAMPIRFVDGDEPPFLLVHGRDDDTVESRDSSELAAALQRAGVEVELLLLADAGHIAPIAALYAPGRAPQVLPALLRFIGERGAAGGD